MKNIKDYSVRILIAFILLCIGNSSCNKANNIPEESSYFKWSFEGQNYTANIDSTHYTPLNYWMIYAGNGQSMISLTREVAFSLASINVGSYSLNPGSGNYFGYMNDQGTFLPVITGSIEITNNANNIISGNFSAIVGNATTGNKSISGSFKNFEVLP